MLKSTRLGAGVIAAVAVLLTSSFVLAQPKKGKEDGYGYEF